MFGVAKVTLGCEYYIKIIHALLFECIHFSTLCLIEIIKNFLHTHAYTFRSYVKKLGKKLATNKYTFINS